jgi:hypothetical protein
MGRYDRMEKKGLDLETGARRSATELRLPTRRPLASVPPAFRPANRN